MNKNNSNAGGRWPQLAVISLLTFTSGAAFAADRAFVETDELRLVYYDPAEFSLVPHVTQSFLSALANHQRVWGYVPNGGVTVFLRDWQDSGNARTFWAPRNLIDVDIAPSYYPYETISSAERFESIAVHELTHVATTDRASPEDYRWRHFFHGKVGVVGAHPESLLYNYLTVPRNTAPRWYQEGSAVFMETWLSGGRGRAQGGYDEMVFRAMVQGDAKFYDPLGLVSKGTEVDFQTGANAYLYGTRFMDYLALTYGPQRLLDWWRRDAGSRRYYADDFERVFGLPLGESWHRWVDFEHKFQQQNLDSVHEHPVTPFRDLTRRNLGALSRSYLSVDDSRLFTAVKYPGQLAHLVSISRADGTVTQLTEVKGASGYTVTSLAFDPGSGTLFYTTNNSNYRNLEAFDLRSGKSRMLLKAARIGDIVYNPTDRSLWGLRLISGLVQLVRIPFPYKEWRNVYVFPAREKAFDLDLSADGSLASVSVSGPGQKPGSPQVTQVRVMSTDALLRGDATPLHTFQMGAAVPESFVFSKDGHYLYGSSYYTGVSNIYRYEIATEKLTAVSNAETGFFRPLPLDESQLIVLRYAAKGFVPTLIEAQPTEDLSAVTFLGEQVASKYPEVQHWTVAAPTSIAYESHVLQEGTYRRERELSLESLTPIVEGFQNAVALGGNARFSDPLNFDWISVDTSYSPDDGLPAKQRLHVSAEGHHKDWSAGAAWNGANFYDLFGPTKRSLAGYNGYLAYDRALVFDPPRLHGLHCQGGLLRRPRHVARVSERGLAIPKSLYRGRRLCFVGHPTSPGAVDDEAGYTLVIQGTRQRRGRGVYTEPQRHVRPGLSAAARPFLDLAAQRLGHLRRTHAAIHSRTSISAASATTMSTAARTAARSATASCSACRDLTWTRCRASRWPSRCSNGAFRRSASRGSARPGSTSAGRGRSCSSPCSRPNSHCGLPAQATTSGGQLDFQLHVMHRCR